MRKLSCIFIALSLTLAAKAQLAEHVVLITIDGFRPDFYLDPSWNTVNIRQLMEEGTHANGVNSVFPSMTYPSHTTIITGVQPAKHGVYYNKVFEPTGPTGKIYWNDSSIKVPTIWDAAVKKGLKVAVLLWPVAAGAPVLYDIPDNADMGDDAQEAWSKPVGFTAELRQQVFGGAGKIDYGKDQNVARIAAYVIQKDQPNLMTIHFFSVDHNEHIQGRDGDRVRAAVAAADSAVGIIVQSLKQAGIWDKTVMIVTGDHGFVDVRASVSPNVWLVKAGLITDVKKDDWKAQFFSVGGSSYLYLKDRKDKKTLDRVKEILGHLPEDQQKLFSIVDRKRMESIGGNPEVAFALTGLNGASFDNAFEGEAVREGKGGTHGYFPDFQEIRTGFVARGPGIIKGGLIPMMNLRDIAPALAKILGLSLPSAEGKIPSGLFYK
jgi:predicted AlkP superfamily pyrophosphatase or phosphodiesterase